MPVASRRIGNQGVLQDLFTDGPGVLGQVWIGVLQQHLEAPAQIRSAQGEQRRCRLGQCRHEQADPGDDGDE
jgi:hypothetical protein